MFASSPAWLLGRKRECAEVLGKAAVLPFTLRVCCAGIGCRCGLERIRGGVSGVTGHVCGSCGVTGGTCGSAGCGVIGVSCGSVRGDCGCARLAARNLATRPCACSLDGLARPVVFRVLLLKEREHVLGAVGGPERQCRAIRGDCLDPLSGKMRAHAREHSTGVQSAATACRPLSPLPETVLRG